MYNSEENSKLTRNLAGFLMKIGDIHAKELSFAIGFCEPKISINLLKDDNNK